MVLALSQDDIKSLLTMDDCVQVVEEGFAQLSLGKVELPLRPVINVKKQGDFLVMPGYVEDMEIIGLKMVTVYPNNSVNYNLPSIMGTVLLVDPSNGNLLAVMDGTHLTAMRTGASSGVATKYLSRHDSKTVGIFGSGVQARTQISAISTVRDITKVKVYSLHRSNSENYSKEMSSILGIDFESVDSPIDVMKNSDIIIASTNSKSPIFNGDCIEEGMHINGIGTYTPETREFDTKTIKQSKVFVDSYEASLLEAGDLLIPISEKAINKNHIHAEIGEVITGKKSGRSTDNELTLFKSVGLAVQDLVTAKKIYSLAKESNVGTKFIL